MMKRPLCLVITSWLCFLGQCSGEEGVKVNCSYDGEIRKVKCSLDFYGLGSHSECKVEYSDLCDMDDICIRTLESEALTVDVKDPKEQVYGFVVNTTCASATTSVNITLPPGKHDKFEKDLPPPEDHQVPAKPMWAILGTCIVICIVFMVFLYQHRLRMCSGSPASDDVESHNTRLHVEGQHSPPDLPENEPLSGGQEPRETHPAPVVSPTDEIC
ncbi:uncharacterized protein LOC134076174 [Sardina pilchardus]|uniref:uncharacterized protein LOC134076174 n=1 Tax=Sardina pilchardus TaxID=27697 RepID=UPI002E0FD74B